MIKIAILLATVATAFSNEGDPTEQCETVTIETENGPVRINASDFDEAKMKLADAPAPAAPSEPAGNGEPVKRMVSGEGAGAKRRFFIVDESGVKLTGEGIDEAGYASDAEAWAAITAIQLAEQSNG